MAVSVCLPCSAATLTAGSATWTAPAGPISIDLHLISADTEHVAGIQCDILFPADILYLTDVSEGSAAVEAGKTASFNLIDEGWARLAITGINRDEILDGTVAHITFDIDSGAGPGAYTVALDRTIISDTVGLALPSDTVDGTVTIEANDTDPEPNPADANQDGSIDALDVQSVINAVLGSSDEGHTDLNDDGVVNAVDIQLVINAVLGL